MPHRLKRKSSVRSKPAAGLIIALQCAYSLLFTRKLVATIKKHSKRQTYEKKSNTKTQEHGAKSTQSAINELVSYNVGLMCVPGD